MNKIYTSIVLLFLCFTSLSSQVEFEFTSDTVSGNSQTVDVDVLISNFTDIISMQFSINWDPQVFSFNSVQNVTTDLAQFSEAGNMGTPPTAAAVDDGELTVSWNLPSTDPVTLTQQTRLFTIRLSTVGNNCDNSSVFLSDVPRIIEFIDSDFAPVDVQQTEGFLLIDDGTCSGGGGMEGVGLIVADTVSPKGTSICIPVTTTMFNDIASVQSGITWDPAVLEFTGITEVGLNGITTNETMVDNGELRMLWFFETVAISVPEGGTLFELCFNVVGNTGENTVVNFQNLTNPEFNIEISNSEAQSLDFFIDSGTFTVGSGDPTDQTGVGFIAPDLFTGNATSICVPVTTRNFNEIFAIQTGIGFDPAVLSFTGVNDVELQNVSVGDTKADEGELRVLWIVDIGSPSESVADDATLFELCFDVVGNIGESSAIGFINIPFFPIEVVDEDAQTQDYFIDDGSVTIGNDINTGDFSLIASDHVANEGDTVCVDITVEGFTDIQGMGFIINWDETVIDYLDQRNFNLPSLSGGSTNFNFISPDKLRVIWTPASPQTVADGTSIFQVCYEAIGNCDEGVSTSIDFISDASFPIEIIDANTNLVAANLVSGSVTIDTCEGPIEIINITNPTCTGDVDGAVAINLRGFTGTTNCVWTDADGNEVSTDCNLLQVGGGAFTLTVTDENNMMASRTVNVIEPSPIVATASIVDGSCDQQSSITLNVSGGTSADGTYSYMWSGGLADTNSFVDISGTFDVTISDDNSCSTDTSFIISNTTIPTDPVVVQITNLAGNNGSIDLNLPTSDGITFSWSSGQSTEAISDLIPGNYMVTITNSNDGCEKVESFDLDWAAVFGDDIVNGSSGTFNGFGISCDGESDGVIDGTVIGGCAAGPVTIFLDGQEVSLPVSGLGAGSYVLRVEDACGNFQELTIELSEPDPIVSLSTDIVCSKQDQNDGSIDLNLSGGVGSYDIASSAGTVTGNDGIIENLPVGVVTVVVEDENGCQFMFQNLNVEQCAPDLPCSEVRSVISPNGDSFNDSFEIGCIGGAGSTPNNLSIFDRWGNLVFETNNYDNSWNGTDQGGEELNEGGYMYVLSVGPPGARELFRGTVTILR